MTHLVLRVAAAIMLLSTSNNFSSALLFTNNILCRKSSEFKNRSQIPYHQLHKREGNRSILPFSARSATIDRNDKSDEKPFSKKRLNFVTTKQQVYIEDTDAYGVMYNANYLRTYDRALHMVTSQERKETQTNYGDSILSHDGWCVIGVSNQRFKSGISLGSSFVVSGMLENKSDDGVLEVWNVQLTSVPDPAEHDLTVYNSAKLTIANPNKSRVPLPKPFEVEKKSLTVENIYTVYRDEFDIHMPSHIPLRNVLNLFERERSNFLGGPEILRKMQDENDLLWVVIDVSDLALVNFGKQNIETQSFNDMNKLDTSVGVYCKPGQEVVVRTDFVVKRKGMILECKHTLFISAVKDSTSQTEEKRLAQGIVTVMAIKNSTRRPTTDIPNWLLNKLKYLKEKI